MKIAQLLEELDGFDKNMELEFVADNETYESLYRVLPVEHDLRKDEDKSPGIRQFHQHVTILLK